MNSIYRSIWNEKTGTFVAVCENAKSAGKQSRAGSGAQGGAARVRLKGLSIALAMGFGMMNVYALPTGGAVTAGGASITTGAGTTLINQSTPNAVINWQSFNVGLGETVQFVQPSSNSVALNRVLGADPSTILGNLAANGKVFLMNPNGILFGKGAQVNVGGLVASTLDLADGDFMSGHYSFSNAGAGTVRNQGNIHADGGYVALLGANVSNEGTISAQLGTVALVAGNALTLDVAGDGLLNVAVNAGAVNALVQNGGMIRADGGQVVLSAQAAGGLLQSVVNNTGVIQARTLENRNGSIRLLGDMESGTVNVGGTLDVSGTGAGQTAGSVKATGHHVGLFGARINASGDAGGGTVLVGGDFQGKNPLVPNAAATYMSADSQITADAITSGNGGKVVLWSNDTTRAHGSVSAQGGAQGGNGGLIETSSHWLDVAGIKINANAPYGKSGMWLLDPTDVTIQSIGPTTATYTNTAGVFADNGANAASSILQIIDLQNALILADITVSTASAGLGAGNITVADALTWPTHILTLNAVNNVNINAAVTGNAIGSGLKLIAGNDVNVGVAGALVFSNSGSMIEMTAGNNVNVSGAVTASQLNTLIKMTAGNDVLATAAVTATGLGSVIDMGGRDVSVVAVTANGGGAPNSVNLHANRDVIVNDAISAAGGNVMLRADSDGSGPGVLAGTVRFAGPGKVSASTTTTIRFNPNGYTNTATEIAAYNVAALVTAVTVDAKAWVFPVGLDRPYNGLTTATLQFKNPAPADNPNVGNTVTLNGGTATFNTKDVGTFKPISYNGYTLGGGDQARFAIYSPIGVASGNGTTTANITAIPLTVTANDHSPKIYGSTVSFTGTEYTSTGLVNSETVGTVTLVSAGAPPGAPVAVYAITPSGATANGPFLPSNYTITYINGTLPVTQAPLTIKANDATKTGGDTFTPSGTAFTTPVAPQNGETVGSVTITSPGATSAAPAGTYALTPSNATGGTFNPSNYAITYTAGALTVTGTPIVTPPVFVPPVVPPVVVPPDVGSPVVVVPPGAVLLAPLPTGVTPPAEPAPFEVPTITTPRVPVPPVVVFAGPLPPPVSLVVTPVPVPPTVAPPPVFVAAPPLAPPDVKKEVPVEVVPETHVPPRHPRKQDRN